MTEVRAVIYLRVSSAQQVEKDLTEEGYSIPAQREACLRFLEQKGWELAHEEYVDAGESARSADRPALQHLLADLREIDDVKYVVVHKIDRMARNLEDHAAIRAALAKSGARLVSVTEATEDSPSGRLLEGFLATMAEYYSANLGQEIKKGMNQKLKMGGWPRRAPLGYLNKRETIDGRSVASVIVDPERAPFIVEAFEAYADGRIGAHALADRMAERGLRSRNGKVVSASRWLEMLHNLFYVGRVFDGEEERKGLHPPLVSEELFQRVQNVLEIRDYAGPRQYRHFHPLKGTLYCGVCGALLSYSKSKGRHEHYEYFYCLSKARCSQPFVRIELAEEQVEKLVPTLGLAQRTAELLREGVRETAAMLAASEDRERARLTRKLERLENDRSKVMQAFYANKIDMELLGREQQRISRLLGKERRELSQLESRLEEATVRISKAIDLLVKTRTSYHRLSPAVRRQINRALFKGIYLRDRQIEHFELKEGLALIQRTAASLDDGSLRTGSKMTCLVEVGGFEPGAFSLSRGAAGRA
jgi:site-specific DNA recombinase